MSWAQITQYPVEPPWDSFYESDTEFYAAETGAKIYTFASTGVADSTVPYQFYEYNPATNAWTVKATPGAESAGGGRVTGCSLAAGGGHVYRVGGSWQSDVMVYSPAKFYDYNISTNAWSEKANPAGVVAGVSTSGGGVIGATFANGLLWILTSVYNATLEVNEYFLSSWNPSTNTWSSQVTQLPGPYMSGSISPMVTIGNDIYIAISGSKTVSGSAATVWSLYKYTPGTGVWTQVMENMAVALSQTLESGTLLPTYWGGAPGSSAINGIVAQSSDILQLFTPFKGTYSAGPVGVSLTDLRPQMGDNVKYTLTQYIADQGLVFYESNDSGNRGRYGLVGYNGSIYNICPRSQSTSTYGSKADRRCFKYTPDGTASAPTAVVPATGATVNTDVPVLSADVLGSFDKKSIEWQIASDAAFTLSKRYIFDYEWSGGRWIVTAPLAAGGTYETDIKAGSHAELTQGTWYMRSRVFSGPDASPWSATATITVSHPPALSPTSPINDTTLDFGASGAVTFQWAFNDTSPTDVQTAYQIIVERNSDGVVLLDTGKINSQTARSYAWNLPAAEKDGIIRWKIRGWDSDDVVGAYSNYALFRMSDKPVVAITSPAEAEAVTTGRPIVNWTFTASAGRTQASYRVRFYYNGTTLVHDSGTIAGTELTYQPAEQVLDVGSYTVQVDVVDNRGLPGTDSNSFTTSYDAPNSPVFNVNSQLYADNGFIEITWGSANQDYAFSSYAVYRRSAAVGGEWTKLGEDSNVQGAYTFRDYTAASGIEYEYVVTQKAYRFSVVAESSKAVPGPQLGMGVSPYYVLVHPTDDTLSIILRNVKSDSFTDEHESAELNLINRGRHVDHGSRWGYKGSLSAQIRYTPDGTTPREQRLRLELIKATKVPIYLRNPFGDVWKVDVGNIQIDRVAGVGTEEFVDVTIPYSEVS